MAKKTLTAPKIAATKKRNGDDPLVMLTAYDAPSARMVSEAGADLILVGDSLAMVVLGYEDTLQVTVDDMVQRASEHVEDWLAHGSLDRLIDAANAPVA